MSVSDEHGCVSLLYKKDVADLINKISSMCFKHAIQLDYDPNNSQFNVFLN